MGLTNFPHGISSMGVPVFGGANGVMAYKKVYFVNGGGGSGQLGSDGNSGLSMDQPFLTIQKALNTVRDGDTIMVDGGGGNSYNEVLTTGQHTTASNMADGKGRYCQLIGIRPTEWTYDSPQLYATTDGDATLFIRSPGWRVSGFRIVGDTGTPIGLKALMAQAGATTATNWSPGCTVDNVVFYGAVGSSFGLSIGSCGDWRILNCIFEQFKTANFPGINDASDGGSFLPQNCRILNCVFADSAEVMDAPFGKLYMSECIVGLNKNNAFAVGAVTLTGGDNNVITKNFLGGTYTSGGAYIPGTSDNWNGNWVSDTGTGITTGYTTGVPNQ